MSRPDRRRAFPATAAAAFFALLSLPAPALCQSARQTLEQVLSDGTSSSSTAPITASSSLERRRLEDGVYMNNNNNAYPYDLSEYSIKYEKCQNVQTWSDELAEDEESGSVLAVKHFVVFRLCPSDSCNSCNDNYGEYVLPAEEYLTATTERTREAFEKFCQNCEEACNNGGYCDAECSTECATYDNLGNNGYVDASNYVQCQQIDMNNDDDGNNNGQADGDDEDAVQLYIGPRCSSNGKRIYIGLFSDEECGVPYEAPDEQTVSDYIGAKLWYHTLKNAYSSDSGDCMSCAEDNEDANDNANDENQNNNDMDDADNVNEMCEEVYYDSAKCESKHGITAGFIQTNREEQDYENQVENEFIVCNFIESLVLDSYTEMGEINIYEEQDVIIRQTTALQKFIMTVLSLSILGILTYAVWLSRAIDVAFPSMNLFACPTEGTLV